jgi:signal transduction histidine kinase
LRSVQAGARLVTVHPRHARVHPLWREDDLQYYVEGDPDPTTEAGMSDHDEAPEQNSETAVRAASTRRSLARHLSELQILLDQAPSFLALTQGEQHVVAIVNQAYLQLVGRDRDAVIGKPLLEAVPELHVQGLGPLLEEVLAKQARRTGSGVRVLLPGPPESPVIERRVDFILQPIFDATNHTVGIFIQGLDVTERELAVQALQQADRNKDDFLAKLAHEMLNPLSASRSALDVLDALLGSRHSPQREALGVLQRQHSALSALVEDLLDVSRIKLGKLALAMEAVTLQDVVTAAVETCQHRFDAKAHALRLELPATPVKVVADKGRLVQVVVNLLANAAKFTAKSGEVSVTVRQVGDAAQIVIADNGKGMTAQEAQHVFELYHQNPDEDRKMGGLGIGLALVRDLVELQGGRVWADSEGPSLGTTITVQMPTISA